MVTAPILRAPSGRLLPVRFLLGDLPWDYNDRRETRRDNPEGKTKFGIGAQGNYAMGCMSTEDLCVMRPLIDEVTSRDCYLGLWATCPRLEDCLRVGTAWGFEPKTVLFCWVKTTANGLVYNPGRYTHSNIEIVMLFRRRGQACWHPREGYRPHQVVMAPRPTASNKVIHSAKPHEVQDRIDQWLDPHMAGHSKLELFARRRRFGWICMGGDLGGRDIRDDLGSLARILRG